MGIKETLKMFKKRIHTYLPLETHTLLRKEKIILYKFLYKIKIPKIYSLNIRNLISMKNHKLKGLKFNDYYALMEYVYIHIFF